MSLPKILAEFGKYVQKRMREAKHVMNATLTPDSAEADIAGQKITFLFDVDRKAAWKLYVELNTRIASQPLGDSEGFIREAMSSLYAVFAITRDILKEAGPSIAIQKDSLGFYAMAILNSVIRPFLSKWHPELKIWEESPTRTGSAAEHERKWERSKECRRQLQELQRHLEIYTKLLGELAGISVSNSK